MAAVSRLISFVLAAVIGGVVVWWLGGGHAAPEAPVHAPLASFEASEQTAEVTQMPAAERVRLGGYVEARNSVRLAAQAPGRVTYLAGQEGERIAAGQLVAALDDDALRPEYRAAWAALSSEMTDSSNAQTQLYHNIYGAKTSPMGGPVQDAYERTTVPFYNMAQGFFGSMMPGMSNTQNSPFGSMMPMQTQQQASRGIPALFNARADYERRLSGLAGAQSRLDSLDARARDRRSIAPWGAAIIKRHVRVGDVVQPGQPLVDIADVDQLDVRIEVPMAQIGKLKAGDQVPVTIGNANVWAPVSQIYPVASDGQRTVSVKLALPAGSQAAPGMYALAWLAQPGGGSPSALAPAIPTSAISRQGSLPVAYAVDSAGHIEMRVLRLGDSQGDYTAVLSGLRTGERVIARPSANMPTGGESAAGAH